VPPLTEIQLGAKVPERAVADQLVDAYLRTFESVYRILHIPTFWQDYHRYWDNPGAAAHVFVIQMQLVMAIGVCFYDDACSLRHLAYHWVYEAQLWLLMPPEKSKMSIPGLQIMCLLHIARQTAGIGPDLVWISAGSLLRTAMYMGYHRDPAHLPKVSRFLGEMRRRLWATILEMSLQFSMDSGGPVLVGMADFDTHPPGNYNDDQLTELDKTKSPGPKPLSTFTQTTVQIGLLRAFPVRLAIARYINDFRNALSYDETLRLNSLLTSACRELTTLLQSSKSNQDADALKPSRFQIEVVDRMTLRFFLALHQQYLKTSFSDPKFYFSRKICVDIAMKLCNKWLKPESAASAEPDDMARLAINGAGGARGIHFHAIMVIGLELICQLEQEVGMGTIVGTNATSDVAAPDDPEYGRRKPGTSIPGVVPVDDVLSAFPALSDYAKARILAGETNVKGYLFMMCLPTQAAILRDGGTMTDVTNALMEMIEEKLEGAVMLLEDTAAQLTQQVGVVEVPQWDPTLEEMDSLAAGTRNGLGDGLNLNLGEWGWEDLVSTKPRQSCILRTRSGGELTYGHLRCMNPALSLIFSASTSILTLASTRDSNRGRESMQSPVQTISDSYHTQLTWTFVLLSRPGLCNFLPRSGTEVAPHDHGGPVKFSLFVPSGC